MFLRGKFMQENSYWIASRHALAKVISTSERLHVYVVTKSFMSCYTHVSYKNFSTTHFEVWTVENTAKGRKAKVSYHLFSFLFLLFWIENTAKDRKVKVSYHLFLIFFFFCFEFYFILILNFFPQDLA